jgi:site-specific recombinase XerD
LEVSVNHPLAGLCDQFLKERTYLKNVTPRTVVWYEVAFKAYRATISDDDPPLPTKATLQRFVVHQRERGLRPVTCNIYIGAMNAVCTWLHHEGHLPERLELPKLRVEHRVLTLLSEGQMRLLIGFRPRTFRQSRLHTAILVLLDNGLRISEALNLRQVDIDYDNLILRVLGKGQKERLMPFSMELRKRLYRFQQLRKNKGPCGELLFAGFGATPCPRIDLRPVAVVAGAPAERFEQQLSPCRPMIEIDHSGKTR